MFFSNKIQQRHTGGSRYPEASSASAGGKALWIPTFVGMTLKGEGGAQNAKDILRGVMLVIAASFLLTLSAKVQVPFWPVPMTMQSLVVVVLPMMMGMRLGFAAVLLYLMQGLCGLPVFAGTPQQGVGLAYMAGPTGGFLLGFLAAAWVSGALFEKMKRTAFAALSAALIGHAVLFLFGAAWLAQSFGWEKALAVGVAPFLFGSVIKSALPAAVCWVRKR